MVWHKILTNDVMAEETKTMFSRWWDDNMIEVKENQTTCCLCSCPSGLLLPLLPLRLRICMILTHDDMTLRRLFESLTNFLSSTSVLDHIQILVRPYSFQLSIATLMCWLHSNPNLSSIWFFLFVLLLRVLKIIRAREDTR